MPHSSGGGSHSGGSHGGGSHSSGGSHRGGTSVKKPSVMNHPARGYSRYAFYDNRQVHYQYVKDKPATPFWMVFMFLFLLPFFCMGIHFLLHSVTKIAALDPDSYDSKIVIEDRIGVMTEKEEADLINILTAFREKTGIACAVITAYNSDWNSYYNSMETYAYDLYVNHWSDENHWLFVYSEQENAKDSAFVDFYWEGMQGDHTDVLLPVSVTGDFNEQLHRYLIMNSYTVAGAFTKVIGELTGTIKTNGFRVNLTQLFVSVLWLAILCFVLVMEVFDPVLSYQKAKKEIQALHETGIPAPDSVFEDSCAYCCGLYIHGKHLECPHCGAVIPPVIKA